MQNLYNDVAKLLEKDERFFAEGKILKNIVTEAALKMDSGLFNLLLESPKLKEHFFIEVTKSLVFDQDKFIKFINNKEFLPDSFTAFKNHVGLIKDNEYLKDSSSVVLAWPYKDCVLEGGQDKENLAREEIFYNETLAPDEIDRLFEPKVLTNFKKIDKSGEHKVEQITKEDNLIIKGNNLLTLHTLKEKYRGKVKLIYIDPPYNTGAEGDTFAYNNNFKHSSWLTFIKNRLEVAKEFLRNDGFIAIAIDHVELYYLGALADEIFGRENRVGLVTVLHNPKGRNLSKFFSANSEFMLVYAKDINIAEFNQVAISDEVKNLFDKKDEASSYRYEPFMRARTVWSRENKPNNWYPIYVSKDLKIITADKKEGYYEVLPITNNGKEMAWKNIRASFIELNKDDYFVAEKEESGKIRIYHKFREQQVYKNVWTDKKYQSEFHGTNLLKKILGTNEFSYPKSVYLVIDTLKIMTTGNDIILDFFAGSGTTAHAVLELNKSDKGNRKFILCEQMDYVDTVTKERVSKVIQSNGKGSFVYMALREWNENYIQAIQEAKTAKELAGIYKKMQTEAFFRYEVDLSKFDQKQFAELSLEEQKQVLVECLDKNHLYVNYSELDDSTYKIPAEEKKLNKLFYGS